MADTLSFVLSEPLVDVHEHHMPEVLPDRDVGLLELFRQSYAGWTQARPYTLPTEEADPFSLEQGSDKGSWDDVAAYVERSGTNGFVASLVSALDDLYELGGEGITRENWEALDEAVRERHAHPAWSEQVITRARIEEIVTDPFSDPLLDARQTLGPRYSSVARI